MHDSYAAFRSQNLILDLSLETGISKRRVCKLNQRRHLCFFFVDHSILHLGNLTPSARSRIATNFASKVDVHIAARWPVTRGLVLLLWNDYECSGQKVKLNTIIGDLESTILWKL